MLLDEVGNIPDLGVNSNPTVSRCIVLSEVIE